MTTLSRLFSGFLILLLGSLPNLAISIKFEDIINENRIDEETTLSEEDFAKAPKEELDLTVLGIQVKPDPTMGNKTEGDIAIPNLREFIERNNRLGRSAVREIYRRWPYAEIPYAISTRYGPYSRSVIAKAMQMFHDLSCIRFVPRDTHRHRDYLYILPDDGCYSLVGRAGGRQPVSLEADCIQSGTIIHELMHAVGFFHEQSRPDRDDYIEILWQNVMSGAEDQFDKHSLRILDPLSEPYDYTSIMHYGPYAFSGNGRRTIIARKPGAGKMGQRESFSEIDVRKINKLYSCPQKPSSPKIIDDNSVDDGGAPVPLKPDDECVDKSWRCAIWSLSIFDYCERYDEIGNDLCRKSCGTCYRALLKKTTTTTTTRRPKIGPVVPGEFAPELLAATTSTTASTTTTITTTATTRTTTTTTSAISTVTPKNSFGTTTTVCRDLDFSCPIWARLGDCTDIFQQNSMRVVCPYSCGLCPDNNNSSDNNKTPKKPVKICEDRGSYLTCKLALFFDECHEKVNLCAKTCGAC